MACNKFPWDTSSTEKSAGDGSIASLDPILHASARTPWHKVAYLFPEHLQEIGIQEGEHKISWVEGNKQTPWHDGHPIVPGIWEEMRGDKHHILRMVDSSALGKRQKKVQTPYLEWLVVRTLEARLDKEGQRTTSRLISSQ
ncbi:hypothetical protein PCH_Pc21g20840 [Penicillium rubens Wisconsin 54-1255]|uniref:Uncharacterized protein n=1 Tax=Penicillium rubens (strain ATCC 28089 / DSM 1075 / NRRL 1951 / Wisconsin 54-1255) TaxID=500485 RepID=B6HL33_PENRW|nr:hypothetical protein PCH_Pc21g20840 [Penicillium rubens Wisconsin 54-1255]